ncbi:MAG: hypothetical protein GQ578_05820 [Desulfuromonadaceae bacterium]|nr:hypothetical protein [Desulfuromonadaceae bacterium]
MSIWASFQRKIVKQNTGEDSLKVALLAGVLSSGTGSLQRRHMHSLSQGPIDPRQALYGGETTDSSSNPPVRKTQLKDVR